MPKYCSIACLAVLIAGACAVFANADDTPAIRFRRPVSIAAFNAGRQLAVANRDSGSVSVIDVTDWAVRDEQIVGERLSDIACVAPRDRLIVLDETRHEVVVARCGADPLQVMQRQSVARFPVSVSVAAEGQSVAVASLWSRCVTLLEWNVADELTTRRVIELPFAPRQQCWLADGHQLIVAGAFRAQLAVINVDDGTFESVREFPGHNIGGLALSPNGSELYVTHQLLDPTAPTTFDSVHWGGLVENLIRVIPVAALVDPASDLVARSHVIQFGSTGAGAADPAGITFVGPELLLVASSGTNRAAVFPERSGVVAPNVETGRRPTAVLNLPGRERAVVVNTLSDSLTVVDTRHGRRECDVRLGPTPPLGPRERGESLFFDARLSHDNWLSCHSCHTEGHANGLLVDTFSDGSFGTPKRVLSLLGTRDNNPWAWNGSLRTLHEQVSQSVSSSMQGERLPLQQVDDLVAYLHSLRPAPPLQPSPRSDHDGRLLEAGRAVFEARRCAACHVPPLTYTSDQVFDVGFEDEQGLRKFNPPSLRGVSQRDRLLHDGRAASLQAVFREFGHQVPDGLPDDELQALVRFLESL